MPFWSKKPAAPAPVDGKKGVGDKTKKKVKKKDVGVGPGPRLTLGRHESAGDVWYGVQKLHLPILIRILAKLSLLWETLIFVCVCTNYSVLMYGTLFTSYNKYIWRILFITEVFHFFDIVMRLGVEIWRCQRLAAFIVFSVPYHFYEFLVDLLALLPLYSFVAIFHPKIDDFDTIFWINVWRANACLRLFKAFQYFWVLEARKVLSEQGLFLLKFAFVYLVFINIVSCAYYAILRKLPITFLLWDLTDLDESWARDFQKKKPGFGKAPFDMFVLSTHFGTATVTTVGFGDVHGETATEMIIAVLVMLTGAVFLNGLFTSQITNFQLEVDGARFDLFYRLEGILKYLQGIGLSGFFQEKVKLYYNCLWTYREGVDRVVFIEQIPKPVQEDVYYDICQEMFHKSYLFRDLDEAFLRAVSKIIKVSMYNPEMLLCRTGGYANQMYYILQGEVQAMSKHDTSRSAAVLRAGSVIGEMNLFFSCPYAFTVETNTCCQFISIDKEELMFIFDKFGYELTQLRNRSQQKLKRLSFQFQLYGEDPVCWVQRRKVEKDGRIGSFLIQPELPKKKQKALTLTDEVKEYNLDERTFDPAKLSRDVIGRWGDGCNFIVDEDVLADGERLVIFESLCRNKEFKKSHVTPYMTCVVPEILQSKQKFILIWNMAIMVFAMIYSFIGPFCFSFAASSQFQHYLCRTQIWFQYVNAMMFVIDVFVEILGACPVEGFYYKFRDGLQVKSKEIMFYFDILSAIPFEIVEKVIDDDDHDKLHAISISLKVLKLWKVIRYLKFLDNVYPKHLFWFRLSQTFLVLMYGIHFIACIMFFMACPTKGHHSTIETYECLERSWLSSYQINEQLQGHPVSDELKPEALARIGPYLLSFFFSSAIVTSVGFGDFSPQNIYEMMFTILFQLLGFFLIGYYTGILTSALACVAKPRLEFQQKLLSVQRFMQHNVLPKALQKRVVYFYELQFQFHHGVNLPHGVQHFLYDAPDYIKNDALYTDVVLLLDGIPLFSKTESKFIIKLAENMKQYLIPPNITVVQTGEVRKAVYAIRSGSIGAFETSEMKNGQLLLESSGYFGLRDLMYGEPSRYNYITLSFCVIYEISQQNFLEVFEEDEELMEHLQTTQAQTKREIEELCRAYTRHKPGVKQDRAQDTPSWIDFNKKPDDNKKKDWRHELKCHEYEEYFKEFKCGKFFRYFLMSRVIHPAGLFAHVWTSFMSLTACGVFCLLIMETFMHYRPPTFRIIQLIMDLFLYSDVYMRLHWGYYLPDGLLVTHPLKTAAYYVLEGSFVHDVLMLAHPEYIITMLGFCNWYGYGPGSTWFTKLKWIRAVQIKRIPAVFQIIHSVFVFRNAILFGLYLFMAVFLCTIVSAFALGLACPWGASDWNEGDEFKMPFCVDGTWASKKGVHLLSTFGNRWIVGMYYVCQVILVIGFGDMITLRQPEVYLLIAMSVFGFIFIRCIVADITAAEVDSDEVRSKYIDQINRMKKILGREQVSKKQTRLILEHLSHNWKQTKGLQPRDIFFDLHPALESDLYQAFVGGRLAKVPLFEGIPVNILSDICKFVRKYCFLSGERISRFGSMDYHMYIITSGKVWMTDKYLQYGCTLRKNETFGESGIMGQIPDRFTAIAIGNVNVFAISRDDLDVMLNRYPVVKSLINLRTGDGRYDLFENKIYDMLDMLHEITGEKKRRFQHSLALKSQIIKHLVSSREEGLDLDNPDSQGCEDLDKTMAKTKKDEAKRKRWISYGQDDENLPLLYFVVAGSKKWCPFCPPICPPILHPNCLLMKSFMNLIGYVFLLYPSVTMYEVAFPTQKELVFVQKGKVGKDDYCGTDANYFAEFIEYFTTSMDIIVGIYIFIRFFLTYKDSEGNYVQNSKIVALNYLTSPTGILLDLVAVLPPLVLHLSTRKNPTKAHSAPLIYIKLTRLLWLIRYYLHKFEAKDDLSVSTFDFKIRLAVANFLMFSHLLACVFYWISACKYIPSKALSEPNCTRVYTYECGDKHDGLDKYWTTIFYENAGYTSDNIPLLSTTRERFQPWRWYVRSLYWVVTVVSTTGFGDITPVNILEMIMGIIAVFSGAFLLSIIMSQFTAGMASRIKPHREYMYQVKLLVKYLQNIGLSKLRQELIQLYFETVWDNMKGNFYHQVARILPPQLRIEVAYLLFHRVLCKVKFFKGLDSNFRRQVSARVEHSVYLPGVFIVKEGDPGNLLFIVYKGRVSGIMEEAGKEQQVKYLKNIYHVGDTFGRFPALYKEEWCKKSYRAEEYTEVLAISQKSILELTTLYGHFWNTLAEYIRNHYDSSGSSECIFADDGKDLPTKDETTEFLEKLAEKQKKQKDMGHLDHDIEDMKDERKLSKELKSPSVENVQQEGGLKAKKVGITTPRLDGKKKKKTKGKGSKGNRKSKKQQEKRKSVGTKLIEQVLRLNQRRISTDWFSNPISSLYESDHSTPHQRPQRPQRHKSQHAGLAKHGIPPQHVFHPEHSNVQLKGGHSTQQHDPSQHGHSTQHGHPAKHGHPQQHGHSEQHGHPAQHGHSEQHGHPAQHGHSEQHGHPPEQHGHPPEQHGHPAQHGHGHPPKQHE